MTMFYRNVMFMIQRAGYATKAVKSPVQRNVWTTEETELLKKLVEQHGKHWAFLEAFFEGRKANTLSNRYHYLSKRDKLWGVREDSLLLSNVDEIGKDWELIEKKFQGQRTKEELEARYTIIKKESKTPETYRYLNWSKLESYTMLVLAERYNHDWVKISEMLGTRSNIQCYNRYKRIVDMFNPDDDDNIKLTKIEADKLLKAVQDYGLDFKTIKAELGPNEFTSHELEQVYRTQLDPTFCQDRWTQKEMNLLVELYNELDGHMKLVQTRLPKKRSLNDLWVHYVKATQNI